MSKRVLIDKDGSINHVWDLSLEKGALEARFIKRREDEAIVYLSSQTGCRMGCRMCHLTRTGQTIDLPVSPKRFFEQASTVLTDAEERGLLRDARTVNVNFMARGEPLMNPHVDGDLLNGLAVIAQSMGLIPRFKISTIMPKESRGSLVERFPVIHPDIYYSIYSLRESFRHRWLPNALPVGAALDLLADWQEHSHKIPKLHFALIKDENDSEADLYLLAQAIRMAKLRVDVNLVRYNPHESDKSDEGDYKRAASLLAAELHPTRVQVVERVGLDVKASCGMFVSA